MVGRENRKSWPLYPLVTTEAKHCQDYAFAQICHW